MADDTRVKLKRVLWCSDLGDMIREEFGRDWCLQQSNLYSNGESIDAEVSSSQEDREYIEDSLKKVEEWRASAETEFSGNSYETIHVELEEFLACLHHRGKLDSGSITIDVVNLR